MRTALAILSEKKKLVYGEPGTAEEVEAAEMRWLNFLEGQMLMATVNALCTIDDPEPTNWGKRLGGALGRDAAMLMALGEQVQFEKLELKSS